MERLNDDDGTDGGDEGRMDSQIRATEGEVGWEAVAKGF